MNKKYFLDLIVNNKIEKVFTDLLKIEDKNVNEFAVLLSSQYNELSRQFNLGIITNNYYITSKNRITKAILQLINELPMINIKKTALIIGCDDYAFAGKLKNPVNDAMSMTHKLKSMGFEVITVKNPNLREFKTSIDEFGEKLDDFELALFYFAGHGVQINGLNYLLPVDANLKSEKYVEFDCILLDRVLRHMEEKKNEVNMIILDACRINPFERNFGRGIFNRGLAAIDAPVGSIISYATSPGKTASDGTGFNGLYTESLLQEIDKKDNTVIQMFQNVRQKVMVKSNNLQIPWESTSLTKDYYLV